MLWLVKQKQVYRGIQNPIGLMRVVINFLFAKISYRLSNPPSLHGTGYGQAMFAEWFIIRLSL
jgi:hypothetical protein